MTWWGSALNATQNVSLAPTVRIHWVLQSTSPSPVPFSFFSSFSRSSSRVKICLGFLYWTREKKKNYFDILPISLLQIPKLNHVERVRRIESKYPKQNIYCSYKNKYYCILLFCQNTGKTGVQNLIFLHDLHKMLKQNKVLKFSNASKEDNFWELFFGFVQKICEFLQLFTLLRWCWLSGPLNILD